MRRLLVWAICGWLAAAGAASARETGVVAGQVKSADVGAPLSGVTVLVAGTTRETVTNRDGRFTLSGLPPGQHVIVFTKAGYAALSEVVQVVGDQPVAIEVDLPVAPAIAEDVVVVGRLSDYVEATAGASRTGAKLLDVPQAIAVLPSRLIEDTGALDTKELYKHISSVTDSPYSSTVVRGFTQREVLIDGVRGNPYGSLEGDISNAGFSTSQFRLTNVERVEVLKGPASVLYGSSEPGGVINYVRRQPKDRFEARATFGGGQFAQRLGEAEVTGPIDARRTLLYRGAVYFEERDSFRLNADTRNVHGVTSLTWRPSAATALAFDYEYIDQRNGAHRLRGVPVDADGAFIADYRWTATEPTDFTDLQAHVLQLRWTAPLGPARAETTLRYLAYDRRENYHEPRGLFAGGTMMHRDFRDQLRTNDDWTVASHVSAPFATGRVRHDLSVGVDLMRQDHLFRFATAAQQRFGGPVLPLSLASPAYGRVPAAGYALAPAQFSVDTADTWRAGAYVQDLITLGPRWTVLLGARADRYDESGDSRGTVLTAEEAAVTGRAGVVFKPRASLSLYASASNGFTKASVLSQTPAANGPHAPETSRQVEAGLKSEWLEGRVQFTAAAFQTVKADVLRPDPNFGPAGNNFNAVLATGEVRNRGVEFDLAGALTTRWNLAANLAYLDSAITEDRDAALIGRSLPNAPRWKAGVFTRVDLPFGSGVGGSLEYVGDREEPFAGLRAPAYAVVDVHYFHRVSSRVRALLRVENLFDRRYAASSLFAARVGNIPGQPRTISLAFTVSTDPR